MAHEDSLPFRSPEVRATATEGAIMRTTSELRRLWAPACQRELTVLLLHSGARVSVAAPAAEAFRALDGIMQSIPYAPRARDTGGFNCRKITGGRGHSLHAFGIAVDYNWNSNPFRADGKLITDMPPKMVAAAKAVRTKSGAPVFRWGGDFKSVKDAMHFEVVATPRELASGIDWRKTQVRDPDERDPSTWPVLQRGDRGPTVRVLQGRLVAAGFPCDPVDGILGAGTERSVRAFQESRGLDVDGTVGLQTWTALLTDQRATPPEKSPVKVAQRTEAMQGELPPRCKRPSKGQAVKRLQERLRHLGFDPGPIDGSFGGRTEQAVKAFQAQRGLEVDGIVGPGTWAALLAGAA
jgi:peptidoglycan hydrolase-like protein with peptidoglycan-binding domain